MPTGVIENAQSILTPGRHWCEIGSERPALVGLLELLRPRTILEFGTGWGGAVAYFDRYGDDVVTVDVECWCPELLASLKHTTFLHMRSSDASRKLLDDKQHFDFAFVDADHSTMAVYHDVASAMKLADIIVCHDSFYPPTRKGIWQAAKGVYCDLDHMAGVLHKGHEFHKGLRGGFALVIPSMKPTPSHRVSTYPYLYVLDGLLNLSWNSAYQRVVERLPPWHVRQRVRKAVQMLLRGRLTCV